MLPKETCEKPICCYHERVENKHIGHSRTTICSCEWMDSLKYGSLGLPSLPSVPSVDINSSLHGPTRQENTSREAKSQPTRDSPTYNHSIWSHTDVQASKSLLHVSRTRRLPMFRLRGTRSHPSHWPSEAKLVQCGSASSKSVVIGRSV